jgi:hypothetical protein
MLAETGVERNPEEQIQAARDELTSLFPWLDFSTALFATVRIDRAEPLQKSGMKPETSFCSTYGNVTIGWPTKLALAPKLAAEIMSVISTKVVMSAKAVIPAKAVMSAKAVIPSEARDLLDTPQNDMETWPHAPFATPIWDELLCK